MIYSTLQTERKLSTTYIEFRWKKEAGIELKKKIGLIYVKL